MKLKGRPTEIVYALTVADLQSVADEQLGRYLTRPELQKVTQSLGNFIDWHQAITNAIDMHVQTHGEESAWTP